MGSNCVSHELSRCGNLIGTLYAIKKIFCWLAVMADNCSLALQPRSMYSFAGLWRLSEELLVAGLRTSPYAHCYVPSDKDNL